MKKIFSFVMILFLFSSYSHSEQLVKEKGDDLFDKIKSIYNEKDPYMYSDTVYEPFVFKRGVHKNELDEADHTRRFYANMCPFMEHEKYDPTEKFSLEMGLHCSAGLLHFPDYLREKIPSIVDSFKVSEKSPNPVTASELNYFKGRYSEGLESAAAAMENKGSIFWFLLDIEKKLNDGSISPGNFSDVITE